jgi:peptide/nickel transport system ATP-binding protein
MIPLEIRNLNVDFRTLRGWVRVVDNVNLKINSDDEILGLVGESGCGKSTLGLAVSGLLPPNSRVTGKVLVKGQDVVQNPDSRKIAVIFQDALAALNPVLTIGEQIAEIYIYHKNMLKKDALEKTKKVLVEVGLPDNTVDKYPHQLSGGQRQRVLIAMALAMEPDLIIADEPTTALDVTVQAKVLQTLMSVVKSRKIPMIYITHDLALASQVADRIAVMYAGQIIEIADKYELFENPRHPYTKALLNSVPRVDRDIEELFIIEGEPPVPGNFPTGCRFHPRCPFAMDKCKQIEPGLVIFNKAMVRCFLYE